MSIETSVSSLSGTMLSLSVVIQNLIRLWVELAKAGRDTDTGTTSLFGVTHQGK